MRRIRKPVLVIVNTLVICTLPLLAQKQKPADEWLAHPVDNRTFRTYLDFFVYDRQLPFDAALIDSTTEEGVRVEHLSFYSTPGTKVFAHYYQSEKAGSRSGSAAIILHGGTSGGKVSPYIKVLAQRLVSDGLAVMAIDMQYFGERSTELLTSFTEEEKHDHLYNQQSVYLAWIIQTVKDVGRTFDFLVKEKGADPRRITLVGISRGAIVGTIVGGADRRFAAIVLIYGGHFDALEKKHLPAACPANYIGQISPRPLLMINGNEDTDMIKETSVVPLQRLARRPKLILWSEGGHRALPSDEHWPTLLQWLRENVK